LLPPEKECALVEKLNEKFVGAIVSPGIEMLPLPSVFEPDLKVTETDFAVCLEFIAVKWTIVVPELSWVLFGKSIE
jgi:hypothetical protein